jgi:hypothetical protein
MRILFVNYLALLINKQLLISSSFEINRKKQWE